MDTFLTAFNTVLPLFLVIIAGSIFTRTKVFSGDWVGILNKYALYIGFPALIIYSLMQLEMEGQSYLSLILINSAYIVFCLFLVFPAARFFHFTTERKRTLFLILPFANVAYFGIPVLASALGREILPVAAILAAVYAFWLLTLAIILIEIYGEGKTYPQKLALNLAQNPLLVSVLVGLVIVLFQIKLPGFAEKTIELFADSVTAVVLFSLGIFLGTQKRGKLKEWSQVFVYVLSTMLVLPFLFYGCLQLANMETTHLKATIIDAAMPLGLTPYALSIQYKLETALVARVVVLGTALSVFIIPLWIVILG
jgi:hypothetical protein